MWLVLILQMGAALSVHRAERLVTEDWADCEPQTLSEKRRVVTDLLVALASASDAELAGVTLRVDRGQDALQVQWAAVEDECAPEAVDRQMLVPHPPLERGVWTQRQVAEAGKMSRELLRVIPDEGAGGATPERRARSEAQLARLAAAFDKSVGIAPRKKAPELVKGFAGDLARERFSPEQYAAADQLGQSVEFYSNATGTLNQYWSNARSTQEYITARGWEDCNAWTFERLSSFCALYVLAGYKASSLRGYLSSWAHCSAMNDFTLPSEDLDRLKKVVKSLVKLTDQDDRNYAFPWLSEFTYQYALRLGKRPALEDLQFLAASALRGGTGGRASSTFGATKGTFKIMKKNVVFAPEGCDPFSVAVYLPEGKSAARWVHFQRDEKNPFCTYSLLRRWYDVTRMDRQPPTAPFFPKVDAHSGKLDWSKEQTKEQFLAKAHAVAAIIELPKAWIARIRGHSWRAALATDLLSRGVAKWKVKIIGGWKSDCVLLYARVTGATMAQWTAVTSNRDSRFLHPKLFMTQGMKELAARSAAVLPADDDSRAGTFEAFEPLMTAFNVPLLGPVARPPGQVQPPLYASVSSASASPMGQRGHEF